MTGDETQNPLNESPVSYSDMKTLRKHYKDRKKTEEAQNCVKWWGFAAFRFYNQREFTYNISMYVSLNFLQSGNRFKTEDF